MRRVRRSGKATTTDPCLIMKKLITTSILLLLLAGCENPQIRKEENPPKTTNPAVSLLDQEIRNYLEKGNSLDERKRQVAPVEAAFLRRTTPERARRLAALCYTKTLGTPFMPFDLAEIALAETGGHGLAATAVSPKGAVGVWQLMPQRAKSHGYMPSEMQNDEKCADAAVRELYIKLEIARGDLERAKKLYCGQGIQADIYLRKIRAIRKEIKAELKRQNELVAMRESDITFR